ncbi:hypothetical protein EQ249_08165 [Citrobacter freundii]|uniref:glycine-rich domain-containing protein n=1 Tax=Citrobacter freundii TaxID=546 RepID=UPI000FFDFC0B|nr:hypothetical protein [Citrobacter freundii]QAT69580.1 hypothetical protein EQ249_08165 [Citrobacter freundii]
MNRSDTPKKQPIVFAVNGPREDLPDTTPSGSNTASYNSGFPPITMTLKSAGGLPPKGQDMNQALFELSALNRWNSAGGPVVFDSAFSTAIGGYPKGAIIQGDDATTQYLNTLDGNTSNPNTGGSGWMNVSKGRLIGVVTFTSSGIYTPTPGTKYCVVEIQGAGGAGGGSLGSISTQASAGTGGNAGSYIKHVFTTAPTGVSVTIGAGGAGVAAGNGNAGGSSSFGSLVAQGGNGGIYYDPRTPPLFLFNSSSSLPPSGGNLVNRTGDRGQPATITSPLYGGSGDGGNSLFGGGGDGRGVTGASSNGSPSSGYGAGGGGATSGGGSSGNASGGKGSPGVVFVWEYS